MADELDLSALITLLEAWGRGSWVTPPRSMPEPLREALQAAIARAREEERAPLERALGQATEALARLVIRGDLTAPALEAGTNELARPLFTAVNDSAALLRSFVKTMAEAVQQIAAGTSSVHEQLAASERNLGDQAVTSQELAATLEELRASSEQIEGSSGSVARMAGESLTSTDKGTVAAEHFSTLMQGVRVSAGSVNEAAQRLFQAVQQVGAVTELITDVADRSDVLALNAALEAARAGEAGNGFGIVADEMRRMSARVLASTAQVQQLVEKIRDATLQVRREASGNLERALKGDVQAQEALGELGLIGSAVKDTSDAAQAIRVATEQQRAATAQAADAIFALSRETTEAATSSKKVRQAAGHLSGLGTRLTELVQRFRLPSDA